MAITDTPAYRRHHRLPTASRINDCRRIQLPTEQVWNLCSFHSSITFQVVFFCILLARSIKYTRKLLQIELLLNVPNLSGWFTRRLTSNGKFSQNLFSLFGHDTIKEAEIPHQSVIILSLQCIYRVHKIMCNLFITVKSVEPKGMLPETWQFQRTRFGKPCFSGLKFHIFKISILRRTNWTSSVLRGG